MKNKLHNQEKLNKARRIFISYGHDEHITLAKRLKKDLSARGHEVWFDLDRLKAGTDWEIYIEQGLDWVAETPGKGCVILIMTPHSVRRPEGYCLNEITRALNRRLDIIPIMAVWCEPPLSITRIQWLDMQDCLPLQKKGERYEVKFKRLTKALEKNRLDYEGNQSQLLRLLEPLPFDADISHHLRRFKGRQWIFDRINTWLETPDAERVFWIIGAPGVGKTAIASWLCYHRREVAAFHLCRHGHKQKSDSRRAVLSIVYQLSTQIPDLQERLLSINLEQEVMESDARTLFDNLIVQPLSDIPEPDRIILVIIDALDEATKEGKNELAAFIASEFSKTPSWLRIIITSRPEPEVMQPLQGLKPYMLDTAAEENEQDIRDFLACELVPYMPNVKVPKTVIDTIVKKSEGIFLYAEWIRKEIEKKNLSLDRLSEFPQGLGGMYVQFFDRQFPEISNYKTRILGILEILAAAQAPLEVSLVSSLFKWNKYEEKDCLSSLGSLFPVSDGIIHPFHLSVMEWLTDEKKSGSYFVSLEKGHQRLSDFCWQEYQKGTSSLSQYSLSHLPYHLIKTKDWDKTERLFTDLFFLEAKVEKGLVYELVNDFTIALEALPVDYPSLRIIKLLDKAIRKDIYFIIRHPSMLFQCLWNSCWWYDSPNTARHYETTEKERPDRKHPWLGAGLKLFELLEKWKIKKEEKNPNFVWIHSLRPPSIHLGAAQEAVFKGHDWVVESVVYSPDGRRIVSGSWDNTVRLWDVQNGAELCCFHGHEGVVTDVAYSPDGKRVVSTSLDKTLRIWDVHDGEEVCCINGHEAEVKCVAYSPDGRQIVSGSVDKTVRVWNSENGKELLCFRGHKGVVRSVAFSPDGQRIASGSVDKTIRVWDVPNQKELHCIYGHEADVESVAYSTDGQSIVSGSVDKTVRVWDSSKGEPLRCIRGHEDTVKSATFSPDNRQIVSGSGDRTIRVWDLESAIELRCFLGHEYYITSVSYSPDGRWIASGSRDTTIRIWDSSFSEDIGLLKGHRHNIKSIVYSPDGKQIISISDGKKIRIWDADNGEELITISGFDSRVREVSYSPDSCWIVGKLEDGKIRVWDSKNGKEQQCFEGQELHISTHLFSPDSKRLITSNLDHSLCVRELKSGKEWRCLKGHTRWITCAAYSSDGQQIVSGSFDKTVRIWDVKKGKEIYCLRGHERKVECVCFSPDGRKIAGGSDDKTIRVWDVENGNELHCLRGSRRWVMDVSFSPDNQRIVSESLPQKIRVWNVETGKQLEEFGRQRSDISIVAFSLFGFRVFVYRNEIVVSECASGKEVAWFPVRLYPIKHHPKKKAWAGANLNYLCIMKLECKQE